MTTGTMTVLVDPAAVRKVMLFDPTGEWQRTRTLRGCVEYRLLVSPLPSRAEAARRRRVAAMMRRRDRRASRRMA